jgi:hypothetical protein
VSVRRGSAVEELTPGEIAVIEAGSDWELDANDKSAVLLTLSWPKEQARV